jgi:hypothetical protein
MIASGGSRPLTYAAKAAIGAVIFGQDVVAEHALVTVLSGGHVLVGCRPRENQAG